MAAGYSARLSEFASVSANEIIGRLVGQQARSGFASMRHAQTTTWQTQIPLLQRVINSLMLRQPAAAQWQLLLEYEIPRRDRRIDAVLLAHDVIFVLEFKVGATEFSAGDRWQTLAYSLDLRDFHEQSRDRRIIPILVVTDAHLPTSAQPVADEALVSGVSHASSDTLADTILTAFDRGREPQEDPIDPIAWDHSAYRPTPTIIEAAQSLFAGQQVREISHKAAHNLTETTDRIVEIIRQARANRRRIVCFVTGIPGAGKTLAGLNAVHDVRVRHDKELRGMFLSGNGPLVKIIREALARDAKIRGAAKAMAAREVSTFIASVHGFIKEYGIEHPDQSPDVHVIVFDEAQRAWNAKQTSAKHDGVDKSEPSLTLEIMERVPEWAVIVALVGGGQEINRGEAGLEEWGNSLNCRSPRWHVAVSPAILRRDESVAGHALFDEAIAPGLTVVEDRALHLSINVRSPRALWLGQWVNAIVEGKQESAPSESTTEFPVALTRSLTTAREWLQTFRRIGDRAGLLASSGALRLRADGIELSQGFRRGFPYTEWFLGVPSDLRASDRLEVAASEFECQGLELDWTCICWGGDFVYDATATRWRTRALKGASWEQVRKADNRRYIANKYRVLLTRARHGMIIWVPEGDPNDVTREPNLFDATARFLRSCGVPEV
jgi:hypothetical protein